MKTFAIVTLGCKVNHFESDSYIESLVTHGYQEVSFKELADVYIINTCSVTNTAASKSRQKIHQAARQNPMAKICVVGCYVQTSTSELLEIPRIDLLVGNLHKSKLVDYIIADHPIQVELYHQRNLSFEPLSLTQSHKTRAYLKIQDGCDQFCSFCIIPIARGNQRSALIEDLIHSAQQLVQSGHQEIILSGIHIGHFGHDNQQSLVTLIERILKEVDGLKRLRLSSIEITEITDDLLDLMIDSPILANHLHIPLQSGCDEILKAMNRPYSTKQFIQRIAEIRKRCANISISTDVIVGFPGETEEFFEETLQFLTQQSFTFIHVFPYSVRKNTVAASMNHQIPFNIKKKRGKVLSDYSSLCFQEFCYFLVNRRVVVYVESWKNEMAMGFSSEYVPIWIHSKHDISKQFIEVLVSHVENGRCFAYFNTDEVQYES